MNHMNPIIRTDSYKVSHYKQYPPGSAFVTSYIEPRWNKDRSIDRVVFFGLQAFLESLQPITLQDVYEAELLFTAHGEPFNRSDWLKIVEDYDGKLPIKITALPEGTVHGFGVPQVQVKNTDPRFPWLTSYVETMLVRAVWYPSTVASVSRSIKVKIAKYLEKTSDDPNWKTNILPFRLHDFGSRGASSGETAALGGMAHLVNFMGTDTVEALVAARRFYDADMAGFSIPASEHSTITTWGREGEADAYANMIKQFGGQGKIFACVSDSYDLWNAIDNIWGTQLHDQVVNNGGVLVVRPDSGDPVTVVLEAITKLGNKFGYTVNSKGYKVLAPCVRLIQGDGINPKSIVDILDVLVENGWAAENIAFGMGGALLQNVNRDTLGYAMKANNLVIMDDNGAMIENRPVFKNPITDHGKSSKAGVQGVIRRDGELVAVPVAEVGDDNQLELVFYNGDIVRRSSWDMIKARADI